MTEFTHVVGKDGNIIFTLTDGSEVVIDRLMVIDAAIKAGINLEEVLHESEQCQTSSSKSSIGQTMLESTIVP